jgi:hypothetical protein
VVVSSFSKVFLRVSAIRQVSSTCCSGVKASPTTWRINKNKLSIVVVASSFSMVFLGVSAMYQAGQSEQRQQGGDQPNYLEDKEKRLSIVVVVCSFFIILLRLVPASRQVSPFSFSRVEASPTTWRINKNN